MYAIGIAAGLATALCWAGCAMFFTSSSRRIGVFAMNNWRVLFGALMLIVAHLIIMGTPIPTATREQWILLIASGLMGIFIGDTFLFQALHDLGPRIGLALFNMMPFMTALLAWAILGETLSAQAWIGIAVTVAGATLVLFEEHRSDPAVRKPRILRGVLLSLAASITCGLGYVIAKPALEGTAGADPLSATLIRVAAAVIGYWLAALTGGRVRRVAGFARDRRAMTYLVVGALLGPFGGIWLSMVALKFVPSGIASTLFATMPVLILPMVAIAYRERITWRAALGAVITVIGVAVLANA